MLLETHVSGCVQALTSKAARGLLWRYRWFTLAVVARIHWHAVRLWTKRVPYFGKPVPPDSLLTRNTSHAGPSQGASAPAGGSAAAELANEAASVGVHQ